MLIGLSLVVASGCITNNYTDREIDSKMQRTKHRALVDGTVSARQALIFASILLIIGTLALFVWTNLLTTLLALFGFIAYVVLYGYAKRKSTYGTLVGSISGALPPVIGYTAVSNQLDLAAALLFIILVCWQMPHFYAIAIYRSADYKAAGIPVLPVIKGFATTQYRILAYIAAFTIACTGLVIFGYAGITYVIPMIVVGIGWFAIGLKGLTSDEPTTWAKKMFGISLLVITAFCVTLAVDSYLSNL